MDDIIGIVIFFAIVAVSTIFNRIRQSNEDNRPQDEPFNMDELPEATRRMYQGQTRTAEARRAVVESREGVNEEKDDWEDDDDGVDPEHMTQKRPGSTPERVRPVPVATQARQVPQPPVPQRRHPSPVPVPPARREEVRPVTVESIPQQRRPVPVPQQPRPVPVQQRQQPQPQAQPSEGTFAQRAASQYKVEQAQQLQKKQQRLAETKGRADREREAARPRKETPLHMMLGDRHTIAYSIILGEILGPPKSMQSNQSRDPR